MKRPRYWLFLALLLTSLVLSACAQEAATQAPAATSAMTSSSPFRCSTRSTMVRRNKSSYYCL